MKTFKIQNNIGKVRYAVSFHDGEKKHADGSPFFDLECISNKRALARLVRKLKNEGYVES